MFFLHTCSSLVHLSVFRLPNNELFLCLGHVYIMDKSFAALKHYTADKYYALKHVFIAFCTFLKNKAFIYNLCTHNFNVVLTCICLIHLYAFIISAVTFYFIDYFIYICIPYINCLNIFLSTN